MVDGLTIGDYTAAACSKTRCPGELSRWAYDGVTCDSEVPKLREIGSQSARAL